MNTYLSIDIPQAAIVCMAVSFISMLLLVSVYRHRVTTVRRHTQRPASEPSSSMPGVSVIVYERDNLPGLATLLPSLLQQDYAGTYDIIVVSDGTGEDARDLVTRLSQGHRNIYLTFVPEHAHNLSRRKLAITLGVKASRQPYVILTSAEARIPGAGWLGSMARNFANGHDIVLGHAVVDRTRDNSTGGKMRAFDRAADAATYLGSAINGTVYRASGYNIGFKRQLYFDNKGFAGSLNLHAGDDDIFVSRIAAMGSTFVELDPQAHVMLDFYNPKREHRFSKVSHRFTGRFVSRGARRFMALGSWLMWIWLICSILAIVLSLPNLIAVIATLVTGCAVWITLAVAWSRTVATLGDSISPWLIPWMLLARPFSTACYIVRSRLHKQRYYTWQKID